MRDNFTAMSALLFKILATLAPAAVLGLLFLWRDVGLIKQEMLNHERQPHDGAVLLREFELELELRDQQHTQMLIQMEQERLRNERQDETINDLVVSRAINGG